MSVEFIVSMLNRVIQLVVIGFVGASFNVYGAYNANAIGSVAQAWTYGTLAAVRMDPMPATGCQNSDFFYITATEFPDEANRSYAHSISMTALVAGKKINVGYDNAGTGCYGGRPVIYRIDLMSN